MKVVEIHYSQALVAVLSAAELLVHCPNPSDKVEDLLQELCQRNPIVDYHVKKYRMLIA